jgi:hypothetical protein
LEAALDLQAERASDSPFGAVHLHDEASATIRLSAPELPFCVVARRLAATEARQPIFGVGVGATRRLSCCHVW